MLLLGVLGLSLLIGLLRWGRGAALSAHHWRALPLPFVAVCAQLLAFLPDESVSAATRLYTAVMHVNSYLILLTFVWLNRKLPWMWVIGVGVAANAAVIIANGGFMPVSPDALPAGTLGVEAARRGIVNNIALMGMQTRLGFLGDIFRTPSWLGPRSFSFGDLACAIGGFALVQGLMRPAAVTHPGGAR